MDHPVDIFKDEQLQSEFIRNGFVKISLLSIDDVNDLVSYYYDRDLLPPKQGFYATMFHPDPAIKREINDRICSTIGSALKRYISGYKPLFGNFIVKGANNVHEVGIHQDWTYVDETKFRSFNVWTSLCHSNNANGGLFMLPGSQAMDLPIRWTPFDTEIYNIHREEIVNNSIGLELQPGEAVVYDSAVIHYSTLNQTDEMRMACGCVFTPENTTAMHYFRQNKELLVYHVDSDFFMQMVPGQKPGHEHNEVIAADETYDPNVFKELKVG